MVYEIQSENTIDQVARNIRDYAPLHNMGVLQEFRFAELLESKGHPSTTTVRVLEVCNPRLAKVVLETEPRAGSLLPCRIAVREDHGATLLSTVLPGDVVNAAGIRVPGDAMREITMSLVDLMEEAASVAGERVCDA